MTTTTDQLTAKGEAARVSARKLVRLFASLKDRELPSIADTLKSGEARILAANVKDLLASPHHTQVNCELGLYHRTWKADVNRKPHYPDNFDRKESRYR